MEFVISNNEKIVWNIFIKCGFFSLKVHLELKLLFFSIGEVSKWLCPLKLISKGMLYLSIVSSFYLKPFYRNQWKLSWEAEKLPNVLETQAATSGKADSWGLTGRQLPDSKFRFNVPKNINLLNSISVYSGLLKILFLGCCVSGLLKVNSVPIWLQQNGWEDQGLFILYYLHMW